MPPLHTAARNGNLERVRQLLNNGANINALNNEGMTPLMVAASIGRANIVRHLLNRGANARARINGDQRTALIFAVESGNVNSVRALLRHSNLNARGSNNRSALSVAMELGPPEIVRMLIRAGARYRPSDLEAIEINHAMRNLVGTGLVRRVAARRTLTNTARRAHAMRRARTAAMHGQLMYAPVREGGNVRQGLPANARRLIAAYMRRVG